MVTHSASVRYRSESDRSYEQFRQDRSLGFLDDQREPSGGQSICESIFGAI
jgi:hypothetical protein